VSDRRSAAVRRRDGRLGRLRALWASAHPTARHIIVAGAVITLVFVVLAVAAPLLAPYGEAQFQGIPQLQAPSARHLFGTTNLRYDVFSRVIFGARLAFEVVVASTLVAMCIGVPLGLVAGYSGGWLDRILVMVTDAMYAFPSLLLAIVVERPAPSARAASTKASSRTDSVWLRTTRKYCGM